jgi:Transposase DDE domain
MTRPDAGTHEIVAVELTPDDVGDIAEVSDLLDQIGADVASITADGAYDGQVVYDALPSVTQKRRSLFHHGSRPLHLKRR